jgi:hypothetical protein
MSKEIFIAVLDRGWVFIGIREKEIIEGKHVWRLKNCHCIRRWGTTQGIGEISIHGPTKETVLDKCNDLEIGYRSVIFWIKCNQEKWENIICS